MLKLRKIYRRDYDGEDVVTDMIHQNQKWNSTKEWIPNSVINNQISNQACVIGNGISRSEFDLRLVFNQYGGSMGRYKLQTYGCNALYRDYTPDFLVASGEDATIVTELANSGYCDDHIVYASASHIQNHPSKFYMIPQDPAWNAGSMATYLAAFDGHTTIFLVGFDGQDTLHYNYNMYAGTNGYQTAFNAQADPAFFNITMKHIFEVYNDVSFVRVMLTDVATMPESWKYVTNLRQISFRQFIIEADL